MIEQQVENPLNTPPRVLHWALASWVGVVSLGLWLFSLYIFAVYAWPWWQDRPDVIAKVSPTQGAKLAASANKSIFFLHILPALWLSLCGVLQLWPALRRHYPRVHRWNGRVFLALGFSGALSGLYLVWVAGLRFSDWGALGITLNGLLIPIAVICAWQAARQKDFARHRRFAIHSFLLIQGVWSFRLYLMGWYLLHQGNYGNTAHLDGWADITLSFACYLLPMAVAEWVFFAERRNSVPLYGVTCVVVTVGVVLTTLGIVAAAMLLWYPRVQAIFQL